MRYGIFSDIHSNLEALEAVLAKLQQEKVDQYICAGDILGYGGSPCECLQTVIEQRCLIVAGEHDYIIAGRRNFSWWSSSIKDAVRWVQKQLSDSQRQFLGNLDLLLRIDDVLTVAHATINLPEMFDCILSQQDVQESFAALQTRLGFMGHSHVPMIFYPDRQPAVPSSPQVAFVVQDDPLLVNVGSVGQPRDENPMACCVVYDDLASKITFYRVAYDIERACRKIIQAGLPEVLAERLRYGR